MTKASAVRPIADDPSANPCISCGACCAYYRVSFYCGELEDGSGGTVPAALTTQVAPMISCMKGTETGHGRCVALVGELGRPGIACRIYERRPSTCREFDNWLPDGTPNPECQRLRARLGLPALAPLQPADATPS
jgi:hypothetical protein